MTRLQGGVAIALLVALAAVVVNIAVWLTLYPVAPDRFLCQAATDELQLAYNHLAAGDYKGIDNFSVNVGLGQIEIAIGKACSPTTRWNRLWSER
jgi:hypothetical protein